MCKSLFLNGYLMIKPDYYTWYDPVENLYYDFTDLEELISKVLDISEELSCTDCPDLNLCVGRVN